MNTTSNVQLTDSELSTLRLLLEFHYSNDEPDEHYPDEDLIGLCRKFGVDLPTEDQSDPTLPMGPNGNTLIDP